MSTETTSLTESATAGSVVLTEPCKIWTGYRNEYGYGRVTREGKQWLLHRWTWTQAHGEIPADKPYILHHCDTPACYEISHLYAGTQQDNVNDIYARNRRPPLTHCTRAGHPLVEGAVRVDKNGARVCLACQLERSRRYEAAHPERKKRKR